MTDDTFQTDVPAIDSLADPEQLLDREDVPFESVTRTLDPEQFEGLEAFYDEVDGVVQLALRSGDGRLLLKGFDGASAWAPPGGEVPPGEDWAEAARMGLEIQTGVDVTIERVALVEELIFERADGDESFSSYGVSFTATLDGEPSEFLEDPEINPGCPIADEDYALEWFSSVPDDANENHIDHIERFLTFTDA